MAVIAHCKGASCRQGRKRCADGCYTALLPALELAIEMIDAEPKRNTWFGRLRREAVALTHLRSWFRTFRKAGFSRRRAASLAWRTTRPITTNPITPNPRTP
jgi:DTW domain-containing protein YfiP